MERRIKNPEFNKTQPIERSLADQIPSMVRESQLLSALHLRVPYDGSDPNVPTIASDGAVIIDMNALRDIVRHAITHEDTSMVPQIMGLPIAVRNIISANQLERSPRDRDYKNKSEESSSGLPLHTARAIAVRNALQPVRKNPELNTTAIIQRPPTGLS